MTCKFCGAKVRKSQPTWPLFAGGLRRDEMRISECGIRNIGGEQPLMRRARRLRRPETTERAPTPPIFRIPQSAFHLPYEVSNRLKKHPVLVHKGEMTALRQNG